MKPSNPPGGSLGLMAQMLPAVPRTVVDGVPADSLRLPSASIQEHLPTVRYWAAVRNKTQRRGTSASALQDQLLTDVGGAACAVNTYTDHMLELCLRHGRYYDGTAASCQPGVPHRCHQNAFELYTSGHTIAIAKGFALWNDVWQEHSWAFTPGGQVLEVTAAQPGRAYFGIPHRVLPTTDSHPGQIEILK